MKKITLLLLVAGLFSLNPVFSQATSQLNFGIIGISYEIPVAADISIAPFAGSNLDLSYLTLGAKGNYYFDNLMGLPEAWDVYGGANLGYALGIGDGKDSNVDLGLQVGGRWSWNQKWGLYLELGGGNTGGSSGLGLTMKL